MSIEYDTTSYSKNLYRHRVPLRFAAVLFEGTVIEWSEDRRQGQNTRWFALGEIAGRVFLCVFTWRGKARRIILLRKATSTERDAYYQSL